MALAAAFDDLRTAQVRREGDGRAIVGGATLTRFFGSHGVSDRPQAVLAQFDPGKVSRAHYHTVDQFQLIIDGKGMIGRHKLKPYCVHFSRAYTPYGPLISDADRGLVLFTLRRRHDPGSQRLPEKQHALTAVPARRPWQVTCEIDFPTLPSHTANAAAALRAIPGMQDDRGLAAYSLRMRPDTEALAPDPAHGDGQYLVVVKGSLLHDGRELKAWALLFVEPDEAPLRIHAGSEGVEAIILNFPRPPSPSAGTAESVRATSEFKIWQCMLCSFVYDEAAGLPVEGIAPGTRWQDVPASWSCPDCSACKGDFQIMEIERI